LNQTRGIIFFRDFIYLTDEEIKENLKAQQVVEIKRFYKQVEGVKIQSGLFSITFEGCLLPEYIKVGYEIVNVRPYIPLPVRCMNCYRFGHFQVNCSREKICQNCSEKHHLKENESCKKESKCINCSNKHGSLDRSCIIFIKEKEIQTIKVLEKVDMKEAIRRYRIRHPSDMAESYASAARKNNKTCQCKCSCVENETSIKVNEKKEKSVKEKLLDTVPTKVVESKKKKQVTLLNKNLNKRQIKALKQINKKPKVNTSNEDVEDTDDSNCNMSDI
jgi:hypothetical protein